MGGVTVRFKPQDAQGRVFGIQVPGRVEWCNSFDLVALQFPGAVTQGENAKGRSKAQGDGKIRVVKMSGWEKLSRIAGTTPAVGGALHFDGQDRQGPVNRSDARRVPGAAARAGRKASARLRADPGRGHRAFEPPARYVEGDREGLVQTVSFAILASSQRISPCSPA